MPLNETDSACTSKEFFFTNFAKLSDQFMSPPKQESVAQRQVKEHALDGIINHRDYEQYPEAGV